MLMQAGIEVPFFESLLWLDLGSPRPLVDTLPKRPIVGLENFAVQNLCWVWCKMASSTIFWVFGMTWSGIEPWSPEPSVNTLPKRPIVGL